MSIASLALLHPSGVVRRTLVLGQADPGGEADLIVADSYSNDVPDILQARLAHDGIAYLRMAWSARRRVSREAGLVLGPSLLRIGASSGPRFLVPTDRATVRWAVSHLSTSRRARAALLVPGLPDALAAAAIARRPGAPPIAAWLDQANAQLVLGRTAALVVRDGALAAVAKASTHASAERGALETLGPAARAAGAAVPYPVRQVSPDTAVLVQTGLPGRAASIALARDARRLPALLDAVTSWLGRWNTATAADGTLTPDLLERELLSPARRAGIPTGYADWLTERCARAEGTPIKLVAVHNDLTTANILVDGDAPLGIVDWEAAEPSGLPLKDLLYFLADARAASEGFRDSLHAFLSTVGDRDYEERLVAELGLSSPVSDLCFHSCWLGHAANEASRGGNDRRFREIIKTIARQRLRMDA